MRDLLSVRVLAALALASGLGGCHVPTRPLTLKPSADIRAEDYEDILARWTRKDEIYDGLDSKLFVHVTFHSPEFRRAFLLRHTDVYGQGSEEARRLSLASPEAEESLEFFFSASTSSRDWNDFDKPTSIWRITLEGADGERVDGKVERVKTTANIRVIYPYITDFARAYTVRFPPTTPSGHPLIGPGSNSFSLRFSSALGQAKLTWTLKPEAMTPTDRAPRSPLPDKDVRSAPSSDGAEATPPKSEGGPDTGV